MDRNEIKDKLAEVIREQASNSAVSGQISDETHLMDIGVDSLMVLEIIFDVEETFSIKIQESELPGIKTVGQVVDLIEKKLREKK